MNFLRVLVSETVVNVGKHLIREIDQIEHDENNIFLCYGKVRVPGPDTGNQGLVFKIFLEIENPFFY